MCCVLLNKHPWALVIHGPKIGGGCVHRKVMSKNIHGIIKVEGGHLHGDGCLLRMIRYFRTLHSMLHVDVISTSLAQ